MQKEQKQLSRLNRIFKVLAWYQVIGGITGLVVLAWVCNFTMAWNASLAVLMLFIALLYAFSIYCGTKLLKNPVKGLSFSLVNQLVQTIHFGVMGYMFKFISGFSISVRWEPVMYFYFGLEPSSFIIQLGTDELGAFVGVNLVAALLSYYIIHIKDVYTEALLAKEIAGIADIGHN